MNLKFRVCAIAAAVILLGVIRIFLKSDWYTAYEMRRHFDNSYGDPAPPRPRQVFFTPLNASSPTLSPHSPSNDLSTLRPEVTVVTAYFDLGSFQKGDDQIFTRQLYLNWMTVFARISNPVVAYFDSDADIAYFQFVRGSYPPNRTTIVKVFRDHMWAFSLQGAVEKVFAQWWYPKHHPNTVVAAYSCAMHAKYELMQRTIDNNPHHTLYVAWLDIGLFRSISDPSANRIVRTTFPFQMTLPPEFRAADHVAYGEVFPLQRRLRSALEIVSVNAVWVCGCTFVARVDVMYGWAAEYRRGVERMLARGLMSTDQQVLYWMEVNKLKRTRIQAYRREAMYGEYFYLGYLCKQDEASRVDYQLAPADAEYQNKN